MTLSRQLTTLNLIWIVLLSNRMAIGDDAAEQPAVQAVQITVNAVVVVENEVSDAAPAEEKPAEAKPADGKGDNRALNLNVIAAPLQALFGIGNAPMAVELAAPLQADVVAQNDALMQQFIQQFRPFLNEELSFVRLACSDLPAEQRPKIKAAGQASLKKAAQEMAENQNGLNRRRGVRQIKAVPEPRTMIRQAIATALEETLSKEQLERYKNEAANRTAHRKRAAILCVVSRLDGYLFLNPDQREKIVDAISTNWQDKWEQWLMINSYGEMYFPAMPDQNVVPFLNSDQKSVWQGLQKIELGMWWNGGQMPVNDGWWGDEPENEGPQMRGGVIFNAVGF